MKNSKKNIGSKSETLPKDETLIYTLDKPLPLKARYYKRDLICDGLNKPHWVEKKPPTCRCGRSDCVECRMAFDFWMHHQIRLAFKHHLNELTYLTFRIPMDDNTVATLKDARANALVIFENFKDREDRRWIGVIDPRIDRVASKFPDYEWALHCVFISSGLTLREVLDMKYWAREYSFYEFQLYHDVQDEKPEDDEEEVDPEWKLPMDYAIWCSLVNRQSVSIKRLWRHANAPLLPRGLNAERFFFVNVKEIHERIFGKIF